jgi:cobalt-zinc-cadmium resistance protein CzcA
MIEKMIRYAIGNRLTVLILSVLLAILGIFQASRLSIDALPDVTNVQVSVVTKSPGLSPIEIEQLITYPIELNLNGIPRVKQIRSISRAGVSSVTVIFNDDVDIYFARQLVNERLRQAEYDIPPGYGTPEMSPIATALGDIYELALVSDRHSPQELRTYLDWELGPKLKSIPGVIEINVLGGELRQYQIIIDPLMLAAHSLSLGEILEKVKDINLNVGGGYIQKGPKQWVIQGEGQFKSLEDVKKLPIRISKNGVPLLLEQLAAVKIGPALRFSTVTRSGVGEVVGMTVIMLKGENSRLVVNAVKTKLNELRKNLPPGMKIDPYYDRSEFIARTLTTVFTNLTEGALLVIVILYFALGSIKGAILVGAAIPFSMLVACIFMQLFGIVGNLMSLGAIDFGLLVDGSVVMLEAVLTSFILQGARITTHDAILQGCIRVGRASAFSVMIILMVYLPLMTLEGVEGKMFRPMAVTIAFALGASLFFTLVTFPATLTTLYRDANVKHSHFWDRIIAKYQSLLRKVQAKPRWAFLLILLFVILGFGVSRTLGVEFLPRIDEGEIAIDTKRLPSTGIDFSKSLNERIEKVLSEFPEVLNVVSRTGRGESAAEPVGTEDAEIMVKLREKSEWKTAQSLDKLMDAMKKKILENVPSTFIFMSQPIENRINEMIAGSKADVVIKIFGNDLLKLKEISEKFEERIKPIPGVGDLRVQRVLGLPLLKIKISREKLALYGVHADEVLTAVQALRVGAVAGKVFEGLMRFDLVVMLNVNASSIEAVENVPVATQWGKTVPLGMVTDIQRIEGPAVIYREALKKRVFVEVNVRGRDLVGFVREAQTKTADLTQNLPKGYEVQWGGQFENYTRAKDRLMVVVPIVALIIFGMLTAAFKNLRFAGAVCLTIPLSLAGGLLALRVRGLPFSIPAAVGFIALSGITVLTGVVYVTALKPLLEQEIHPSEAVILAGVHSARANFTTSLIAAIGFLPMAISTGAGAEVQRPLATVVVGGILSGTLLSQLILPQLIFLLKNPSHKLRY